VRLTWYGTAGFRFEVGGRIFLVDPYLSRNDRARPTLGIGPQDVIDGSEIYLSHGHFDHAHDVPQITLQTCATVHCSEEVATALCRHGVGRAQTVVAREGDSFDLGTYRAKCFNSTHVRFDLPLIAATLRRSLAELGLPLLRLRELSRWPEGQVLAWRFTLAAEGGRVVQHLGSAGCTEEELDRLCETGPPDILLVPLQGNTRILRIAARIVERLRPRVVIPHHHDDFYPPISQAVNIAPFVEAVGALPSPPEVVQVPMGEEVEI
jgi:L-ascorbate metabolism protein UlaG (beta-lactamase superfamily)